MPEGCCRFHGFLPEAELRRVYEACQVMATLPLDEPFGMVLPEAAVRGLLLAGVARQEGRSVPDRGEDEEGGKRFAHGRDRWRRNGGKTAWQQPGGGHGKSVQSPGGGWTLARKTKDWV